MVVGPRFRGLIVPRHNPTTNNPIALQRIKTELWHLLVNLTYLTQPIDLFVISKIRDALTRHWEAKKLKLLSGGHSHGDGHAWTSGMLKNPRKSNFLELVLLVSRVSIGNWTKMAFQMQGKP